jgi:hypothetical protein
MVHLQTMPVVMTGLFHSSLFPLPPKLKYINRSRPLTSHSSWTLSRSHHLSKHSDWPLGCILPLWGWLYFRFIQLDFVFFRSLVANLLLIYNQHRYKILRSSNKETITLITVAHAVKFPICILRPEVDHLYLERFRDFPQSLQRPATAPTHYFTGDNTVTLHRPSKHFSKFRL